MFGFGELVVVEFGGFDPCVMVLGFRPCVPV